MSCLEPGESVEANRLVMPVRLDEAALALEDVVPMVVNACAAVGTCRAVVSIVDRFESCAAEQSHVESIPDASTPIMPLEGEGTTEAFLDTWLAKGTLLGEDGNYTVFVSFLEVMRRPLQGSWTVSSMTVIGTKQSVHELLEELEFEEDAEPVPVPRISRLF